MASVVATACCGVSVLNGINHGDNPLGIVEFLANEYRCGRTRAHFLINEVAEGGAYDLTRGGKYPEKENREGRMDEVAKFIRENDLGTLVHTRPVYNPVHGPSLIRSWIWTPHEANLKEYAKTVPWIKKEIAAW